MSRQGYTPLLSRQGYTGTTVDMSIVTGTLAVVNGGTGATSFTTTRILMGQGTSAIAVTGVLYASSALSPATTDTVALGTTSLMWSDAFFASGAVINFNNGNMTLTHAAGTLTLAGAFAAGSLDDGLVINDTGAVAANRGGKVALWGTYTTGAQTIGAGFAALKENGTDAQYGFHFGLYSRAHGAPSPTQALLLTALGSQVLGAQAALATNATDGFTYIPTCAGAPSGTPTAYTGKVAMIFDTTNNRIYVYDGGWLSAAVA